MAGKPREILRLSELYVSIQGEGPRVGTPTIFVRFGGCNLRCPSWPCDTQHAINPKYRNEWEKITPQDLASRILDMHVQNVCLTGGEPFLQNHDALKDLVEILRLHQREVECFSNGTILYPPWAPQMISFVMDWKLPGSGEGFKNNDIKLANATRLEYQGLMTKSQSIKFTIAGRDDYDVAKRVFHDIRQLGNPAVHSNITIYAGVVWGKLTNDVLIKWILEDGLPWKHTMQVHNHIWDRAQRGI